MTQPMHRMRFDAIRPACPSSTRELAAVALLLSTAIGIGNATAAASRAVLGANPDEGFDTAVRLYEGGQWEQAFANLAELADHGDARAAKLALLMLRYGASLYGTAFAATPWQVARWAQRVLRASSRATASPSSITASA